MGWSQRVYRTYLQPAPPPPNQVTNSLLRVKASCLTLAFFLSPPLSLSPGYHTAPVATDPLPPLPLPTPPHPTPAVSILAGGSLRDQHFFTPKVIALPFSPSSGLLVVSFRERLLVG